MSVRPFFGLLLAMGLVGCGGSATVYRGTMTSTQTAGGQTATNTTTGQTLVVYSGGEGGALLLDLGTIIVQMTRSGESLTAAPGQALQETGSGSTSSQTISSGTGTLSGQNLSINLTGTSTYTDNAGPQTASFTVSFTGQKI